MKNLLVILTVAILSISLSSLTAQESIEIKNIGDKIQLNLQYEGKSYVKTYDNWKEIKKDEKLQQFSAQFFEKCTGLQLENGFNFDLEDGIKIKSDGISINIKNGNHDISADELNISIKSNSPKN